MLISRNVYNDIPFGELIFVRHYIRCNKEPFPAFLNAKEVSEKCGKFQNSAHPSRSNIFFPLELTLLSKSEAISRPNRTVLDNRKLDFWHISFKNDGMAHFFVRIFSL